MSRGTTKPARHVRDKYKKYFILFILFAVMFMLIPYSDDDLRWGSSVGMQRLAKWFDGYGGRYVGYIFILLLTKFYPVKVVFQALTMTLLVYLLEQLSYERQTEYISLIFLFFMPLSIFSDAIGWTSGFANYLTSITFSLIYVRYVYRRLDGETVPTTVLCAIGFIVLGMINTLIVEHFTFYNICLAVFMVLYTLAAERRIRLPEIGYLAGVIAGSALMFSNSTYRKIANGDDFYRSVAKSYLVATVINRYKRIVNYCYLALPLIVVSITVIIFLLWRERRKELNGIVGKIADIGALVICIGNPIILLIDQTREYDYAVKNTGSLVLLILVLLAIVVTVGIFSWQAGRFWQCMGAIISIVIPAIPFFIIAPMSPRCFCGSYIFWIVLFYQLLALIPKTRDKIFMNKMVQKYAKAVALAAVFFYICIYANIMRQDLKRLEYIRSEAANGATEVTVGHLSNENFVKDITLEEDFEWAGYKEFYGIDPDLIINVREKKK